MLPYYGGNEELRRNGFLVVSPKCAKELTQGFEVQQIARLGLPTQRYTDLIENPKKR